MAERFKEPVKWRRIEIAVDSGACESVVDPDELPDHSVKETKASKSDDEFVSATADPIPSMGEMNIVMKTREATMRAMTFTAAPVAKPLGSVKRICQAGHIVVFDEDGSYIYNNHTGEVNVLREEMGNYIMDVWVAPPDLNEQAASEQARSFPWQSP